MDGSLSSELIKWYNNNKRNLPWRNEKDPYKIWLSEIILQQTQVAQGLAYYYRFAEKYPDIKLLARASEDEVLKLWQGLGYYSRARNLLAAAKTVAGEYKGVFPSDYLRIKQLKGVGDYTAAAIASFAFDLPHAVVDGNVYRVLSRVYGITTPINSAAGKKQFQKLADSLLNVKKAALHNQAIMEFGALHCRPVKPACESCVICTKCVAFEKAGVQEFPVKSKKIRVKERHFNYLVIADKKNNILIRRRQEKDIWNGLYEFKMFETKLAMPAVKLFATPGFLDFCGQQPQILYTSKTYKHVLSHQILMAKFYLIRTNKLPANGAFIKINLKKLHNYAFPRLTGRFFDDCNLKEIL